MEQLTQVHTASSQEQPTIRHGTMLMIVLGICLTPIFAISFGVDFSTPKSPIMAGDAQQLSPGQLLDSAHALLRGSFTHTILEWSAVCAALFAMFLTLVSYRLTREPSLPVIGVALACAGAMDAFHTLAADRLIHSVADNRDLIPFTWAICRLFNAIIMMFGVGLFAFSTKSKFVTRGNSFILLISAIFVAMAYLVIATCATSESLPQTMFPNAIITRPYDIYPIVPYLICGCIIFPLYYRRHRTIFAYSLMLSIIVQVATQLYMAFGSTQLHDSAFNVAHALKAVAYAVPIAGLTMEYIRTYQEQTETAEDLACQKQTLKDRTLELESAQAHATANAKFSSALNQSDAQQTFRASLAVLAEKLNAPLLAIFSLHPEKGLTCQHVVSTDSQLIDHDEFKAEGLPTEVFENSRRITLSGPFSSDLLRVRFGLGEIPIHSIEGWPISFHNRSVGVIVTAHTQEPTSEQTVFIESCLSQLGVRLNSFQAEAIRKSLVADLQQKSHALQHAKEAAEQANLVKSEFLANMSHEIRTPLTAIQGFAETLLEADLSQDDKEDAIHTIRRNGDHLLEIINDILDLAKIESGKMSVETVEFSPCDLIAETVSLMKVRTRSKPLELSIDYLGSFPDKLLSDPTRFRQILVNLIGNSIKFTNNGTVQVLVHDGTITDSTISVIIDVKDTGLGMTTEQALALFQPFSQADNSTTRKFGGTGLGLTISKRLATMLGGNLVLLESSPGSGTTFRLTFQAGLPADFKILNPPETTITKATSKNSDVVLNPLPPCRLLLAEDGLDNQRLISHVLRKAGAEVVIVGNGQLAMDEALQAQAANTPFDVILMDMQMPVLDGYNATRKLRIHGYKLPIIALTAHAMATDREKCLEAGCDSYLTKPIQRNKVIDTINTFIAHIENQP